MKKTLLPLLAFVFISQLALAQTATKNYEFRNGNWFNGTAFTTGTWYSNRGLLTRKAPVKIDSIIDLSDRWIVPPFGDAFSSGIADNPSAANTLKTYFDEGVFYLQILNNTQEGRTAAQSLVGKTNTPDAVFANGGFTCTLGYPFAIYEGPANGIRGPQRIAERYDFIKQQRKMLGNAYWFVDNKEMLSKNWEKVMAQKPGVISIYLLDTEKNGGKESGSLTADAAQAIVKKAHKSALRVVAHILTPKDLRLALKIGVDGIASLPGNSWDGVGTPERFELTDDDLKKMAKKKTPIAPLFFHAQGATNQSVVQQWQAKTLQRLFDNGVNVVMGSDDLQRTLRSELNYWSTLPSLSPAAALKSLCENTPQAIFPNRKIGKIAEGYEASFLVLSDNPLANNLLRLRMTNLKVKNGELTK